MRDSGSRSEELRSRCENVPDAGNAACLAWRKIDIEMWRVLASGQGIYFIPRAALHAGPGSRIFPVRHPRQDMDSLGLRDGARESELFLKPPNCSKNSL